MSSQLRRAVLIWMHVSVGDVDVDRRRGHETGDCRSHLWLAEAGIDLNWMTVADWKVRTGMKFKWLRSHIGNNFKGGGHGFCQRRWTGWSCRPESSPRNMHPEVICTYLVFIFTCITWQKIQCLVCTVHNAHKWTRCSGKTILIYSQRLDNAVLLNLHYVVLCLGCKELKSHYFSN